MHTHLYTYMYKYKCTCMHTHTWILMLQPIVPHIYIDVIKNVFVQKWFDVENGYLADGGGASGQASGPCIRGVAACNLALAVN